MDLALLLQVLAVVKELSHRGFFKSKRGASTVVITPRWGEACARAGGTPSHGKPCWPAAKP